MVYQTTRAFAGRASVLCLLWLICGCEFVQAVGYTSTPVATSTPSKKPVAPTKSTIKKHSSGSSSDSTESDIVHIQLINSSSSSDGTNTSSSNSSRVVRDAYGILYECDCQEIRKVSLMGASDYCLSSSVSIVNKCGNVDLAEAGECPRTGSEPCQPKTGHVLTNDSYCALDKRDNTYKCVASKDDLKLHQSGKVGTQRINVKKTNSSGSLGNESNGSYSITTRSIVLATLLATMTGVAMLL